MIPVCATEAQRAYWQERDGCEPVPMVIGGPEEAPDVIPCPALVVPLVIPREDGTLASGSVYHVAMQLDEIEVAHLAQGGTLWMTTWGGLPIHHLEVVPR